MKFKLLAICAFSVLTLGACGGGGSDGGSGSASSTDTTSTDAATGTRVAGVVVASDTGQPLGGVQVQLAGKTVTTAADGSFSHDGLAAADRVVVRFARDGYADAFATTGVIAGASSNVTARMTPVAATATFDNAAGATVSDTASAARVTLAPSSLVNATTGAAPQGAVTATIAPINPATNPANMPGTYTSSSGDPIESFGALSVQLRDNAGNRLNLAAGSKATIRIPLGSRSTVPPQTTPLYYFNESTGLWVEEGSATLAGVAPDQYYEGSVGHFSTWNADQKLDSVFVNGCLVDAGGKAVGGVAVVSEGVDYSGFAQVVSDAQGKFRLAVRKNARAKIEVIDPGSSNAVLAGPASSDITLPTCLVFDPAPSLVKPVFLLQPRSMSAPADTPVLFSTWVAGKGPFTYQ
ncbi:hypothetical protein RCH09_001758 [Actimicrobium sp. GrIS 1.19]|uniref:carboxypeptidase regulatory-like domain-containing protein n=1 Tax=Actimicrobium sp. GrIS 1.19 TaxID=3071708 RepID=UPI002E09D998|nr:hypothetical protein [Actimicrobium sp. GrIS 1.19]